MRPNARRAPLRRYPVRRFPYGLLYRVEANAIFIVAVMHLRQRPGYWKLCERREGLANRLGLGVDPAKVLEDQAEGLDLALPEQEPLDRLVRLSAALRRVERLPVAILEEGAGELLDALLGADASLAPLKPLLIDRTEGNPFFLEESVRTLVETGILAGDPGRGSSRRPTGFPAPRRSALSSRMREPSFEDGSRQGGMSYAARSCKRTEGLQVLLVETYRNLLCARGLNRDVEIFEVFCKLLHAVTRPEVALFFITAETWNLALPCSYRTH